MADNTILNAGSGGDTLRTEDVGAGVKIPVSKIHTGADDTDGGSVTAANPFPVVISSGSQGVGVTSTSLNVMPQSGSVTGLLVGGQALSKANPLPMSGAVGVQIGGVNVSWSNPLPSQVMQVGGQVLSGTTVETVQYGFGDFGTSGSANQVIAPQGAGKRVRVLSAALMSAGAVNVRFKSTGSAGSITDLSSRYYLPASGGFVLPHNPHGWFQTNTNEGLNVSLDSNTTVGITITWMLAGS